MQGNDENLFKLRIKLKTGEEFEAEGPIDFIEQQKEAFLKIIKNSVYTETVRPISYGQKTIPEVREDYQIVKESENINSLGINPQAKRWESGRHQADLQAPQSSQENPPKYSPRTDIWGEPKISSVSDAQIYKKTEENPTGKYSPAYFGKTPVIKNAAERRKSAKPAEPPIPRPEGSVWERIAYPEGEYIIIRRKDKSLTTAAAALIILGAAKIFRNASKMSALELSKSLKLSGYLKENERLDRILAPEIRDSRLVYEGSKRNRDYIITQSGTAKAYTAAERVLLNG